jgi:uncharacterized coiled-coil protein SlyX
MQFNNPASTKMKTKNMTTLHVRKSIDRSSLRLGFLLIPLAVAKQEATITQLKSTVAQQQKGMEVLTATLKGQASQIQKVSAQLEVSKGAPQTVLNNQ